jgi:Na+-driven multidrug efflux pump
MKKMTEGNIYKVFILFAIPLILSGVLSHMYHMIDTMIAGHYLGEHGLAAIGATSSLMTFLSTMISGYIVGFGVYIARLFGAGEYERIRRGIWTHYTVCIVLAMLIAAISVLFRNPIMDLLRVEADIRDDAMKYFLICMVGQVVFLMNTNGSILLGSLGDSGFPFWMSLLSAVLNICGNILSVTVLGLGVVGIAWASVISAGITGFCYLMRFKACFRKLLPERSRIRWSLVETRIALPYSLPAVLQQFSMYVAGLILSPMLNSMGSAVIASYVVSSQLLGICNTLYQNSSRTVSNYAAQCMGTAHEGAVKRAMLKRGLWVGFLQSLLFVLVLLIPCLCVPRFAVSLFFAEGSAGESIALSVTFVRVFLPFVLFNIVNNLFHSFFRGVKAMHLLVIATVFASVVRIAVSIPLTSALGLNGFYIGMVTAWVAEAIFVLILYRLNVWVPKELR